MNEARMNGLLIDRRQFFGSAARGIGAMALASLMNPHIFAAAANAPTSFPNFSPKAKRVIYLFMAGAPSQLDLFDFKPKLLEMNGLPLPESLTKGERIAQLAGQKLLCQGSKYKFQRHGATGAYVSELLPHTARIVDDIAIIRSMHTEAINHDPAVTLIQTGGQQPGRPTMGAWLSYGLGSENQDLPAFVVLSSGVKDQPLLSRYWSSGFLPGSHQGVQFRTTGEPVLFVSNPPGISRDLRRASLDAISKMNGLKYSDSPHPDIQTRIAAFEMAYRMQTSVPELMEIHKEPRKILESYGAEPGKGSFANNCLLARRLVERGVRFVQLYHHAWDHHNNLPAGIEAACRATDQAAAALVLDLKQRGLLDETLVVWGGEFGRTPMNQSGMKDGNYGRDHHMKAFTMWMAGGGIKGGINLGSTDEFGFNAVEDPVHINDFQATLLHCMGVDHEKLTYKFQGRDFRLTDVGGTVVRKLLV